MVSTRHKWLRRKNERDVYEADLADPETQERWAMLAAQDAGDCEPGDAEWAEAAFAMAQECWDDDGYDADEVAIRSEERAQIVRGTDE